MPDDTPDGETGAGDGVIVNNEDNNAVDPSVNTSGSDKP
jgi:hypothetical protein